MATMDQQTMSTDNNNVHIGRRTGKVFVINARLDKFGYERISDYFPDTDSESELEDDLTLTPDEKVTDSINETISNNSTLNKSKYVTRSTASKTGQNKSRNEPASERSKNSLDISPDSAVASASETPSPAMDADENKNVSPQQEMVCYPMARQDPSPKKTLTPTDQGADKLVDSPGSTRKKLRFSVAGNNSHLEQTPFDNGHNAFQNTTFQVEDKKRTTRGKDTEQKRELETSAVSLGKRVTRSTKRHEMTLKDDASFVVSEQSFEPPQKKPLRKQEPSTKKISRIPVSTRSLNKRKTSIAKQDTRAIKESAQHTKETLTKAPISVRNSRSTQKKTTKTRKPQNSENISDMEHEPDITVEHEPDIPVDHEPDIGVEHEPDIPVEHVPDIPVEHVPDIPVGHEPDIPVEQESNIAVEHEPDIAVEHEPEASTDLNDAKDKCLHSSHSERKASAPSASITCSRKAKHTSSTIQSTGTRRNLRSRKVEEVTEEENASISINKSSSKTVSSAKRGTNRTRNQEKSNTKVSFNLSRESIEDETESDSEVNDCTHTHDDSVPKMNTSNKMVLSQRDEKLPSQNSKPHSETKSTKSAAKSRKMSGKSQGKRKSVKVNAARISYQQESEKSYVISSDDRQCNSTNQSAVTFNGISSPETTIVESNIKAPRNRRRRPRKLDSIEKTDDLEISDDVDQGLRRSQRNRVPSLKFWKNDRIEYERRDSGFVVKDIIVNPTPAPTRRNRRLGKTVTKAQSKKANLRDTSEEESDLSDIEIPGGMNKESNPLVTAVDPDTLEEVEMNLIHLAKNLDLRSPASEQDKDGVLGPLLVDKYFSHEKYGVGDILIRPGAEKGRQHVRRDIMIFRVLSGRILVSIHNSSFFVSKGSCFIVPQGNIYNLKNLDPQRDARLSFVQVKNC